MKTNTLLMFFLLLPLIGFSQNQKPALPAGKGVSPIAKDPRISSGPTAGQTYAVVVGISDYQDKDIPDLRFADKDAEAFANFLRSEAGGKLDGDHLKVLLNKEATMAQFANALDWLMENTKADDQAIIYFSGHGDVEKRTLTQPGFLLCSDAPARVYMAGGAFALPMLQEVISTLSIQTKAKVMVITDACRSGKLAGNSVGGAQATASNLSKQFANEIKILYCQPNEYSIEGEQWGGGRGAFSFNLVNALYGMADGNKDLSITLQEVGRYLEDHVTTEVAPVSQLPMVLGNRNEKVATVNATILASLQSGKMSQIAMLSAIDTRGMEEEVLAQVDTSIRTTYALFKHALKERVFLLPKDHCAEAYYTQLIAEPKLSRLHTTLTRNYAAALQDDAQQALNKYLAGDVHEISLYARAKSDKYSLFPRQLERAAQLLGHKHYLYRVLQARRAYFEGWPVAFIGGFNTSTTEEALAHFREALQWQPDMAHALLGLSRVFAQQSEQADSSEIYARLASAAAPSWLLPYTWTAESFSSYYGKFERAKEFLEKANQIDSNSLLVQVGWAHYYFAQRNYAEAERILKFILPRADGKFCLPCAQDELAQIYLATGRMAAAETLLNALLEADSTSYMTVNGLGRLYSQTNRHAEAEQAFRKGSILASNRSNPEDIFNYNMIMVYIAQNQLDKAFESLEKSLMAGNTDFSYMQNDSDLAPLRAETNRWKTLMKKYFPNQFKD